MDAARAPSTSPLGWLTHSTPNAPSPQEVLKHATSLRVPGAAFHISDGELRVTAPGLSEELRKQARSNLRCVAKSA